MGGKEGILDLDVFVAEQLKLLGLEREAEIAEASLCWEENEFRFLGIFAIHKEHMSCFC